MPEHSGVDPPGLLWMGSRSGGWCGINIPLHLPSEVPFHLPFFDFSCDIPLDLPSNIPLDLPSNIPLDLPSNIPLDLPSDIPMGLPVAILSRRAHGAVRAPATELRHLRYPA